MDELQEAAQTITKMSPPMLIIVVAGILNFILKMFALPDKYLVLISTVGGAAVAPWMFPHGAIAYDVPSPGTALVLVGAIMGFVGSVLHRRMDRWIRNKLMGINGHGDTQHVTRSETAGERPRRDPESPHRSR